MTELSTRIPFDDFRSTKCLLKVLLGVSLAVAIFASPLGSSGAFGGLFYAVLAVCVILNDFWVSREEDLMEQDQDLEDPPATDLHRAVRGIGGVVVITGLLDALFAVSSWWTTGLLVVAAIVAALSFQFLLEMSVKKQAALRPSWSLIAIGIALTGTSAVDVTLHHDAYHWSRSLALICMALLFAVYGRSSAVVWKDASQIRGTTTEFVLYLCSLGCIATMLLDAYSA